MSWFGLIASLCGRCEAGTASLRGLDKCGSTLSHVKLFVIEADLPRIVLSCCVQLLCWLKTCTKHVTDNDDKKGMMRNVKFEWLLPHPVGLSLGQRSPVGPTDAKHG